ncbi:MAG: AbiH family protein [Paludibacteraceae bacterium]|nr:AbiH family protein [Paludibacteraceae bacterium]
MRNLVIIGNGFDLAHDLKTSYGDFIAWLIKKYWGKRDSEKKFFDYLDAKNTGYLNEYNVEDLEKTADIINEFLKYKKHIPFKNNFLETILSDYTKNKNWCDIEELYFNELTSFTRFTTPEKLNEDLFKIKEELINYLKEEKKKLKHLQIYSEFFEKIGMNDIILNFNYTNTVKSYLNPDSHFHNLIHIHGNLYNHIDNVIFGYAASHESKKKLIDRKDPEYTKNIKPFLYNLDSNERKLLDFLAIDGDINVIILGHSCGDSDKLILQQIFTHSKVKSIKTCYYENKEHYFQQQINIYKIMDNEACFSRLFPITSSSRMPQKVTDESIKEEFKKNIIDFIKPSN